MSFRKIINRRFIICFITAGLILTALGIYCFKNLGTWLVKSDPLPQTADLIFVFSGDGSRVNYAFELLEHYPDAVLLAAPGDVAHIRRRNPQTASGFNFKTRDDVENTIAEVRLLRKYLQKNDTQKKRNVLLISSPYHMRRISVMTNIVMRNGMKKDVQFFYIPVETGRFPNTGDEYIRWWENKRTKRVVKIELTKLLFYLFVVVNPFLDENNIKENYEEIILERLE